MAAQTGTTSGVNPSPLMASSEASTRAWNELTETLGDLCERSLYLDALAQVPTATSLKGFPAGRPRVVAARLLYHLGDTWGALRLIAEQYRQTPGDAEAVFFYGMHVRLNKGPLAALKVVTARVEDSAGRVAQADLQSLLALLHADYRDFAKAFQLLDALDREALGLPRYHALRASFLGSDNRLDEAIEEVERGLAILPMERQCVQTKAHLLAERGAPDEAIALLQEPEKQLQAGSISMHLAGLYRERGDFHEALARLKVAEAKQPLMDLGGRQRLAAIRSDIYYQLGDDQEAVRQAKLAGTSFYEGIAKKWLSSNDRRKVFIRVPHVSQEHMGCAPATLAMQLAHFGETVDPTGVADQICYEGTASHSERAWLEERGYDLREFSLDWETTRALLDHGLPFSVVTVYVESAHIQLVVGYDLGRGTILLRDPMTPFHREIEQEQFFEKFGPYGPRAVLAVPQGQELPPVAYKDAELYDQTYELARALENHDLERAVQVVENLKQAAPKHHLTLRAVGLLANYQNDTPARLSVTREYRKLFPEEPNARLLELFLIAQTGSIGEQKALLDEWIKPGPDSWIYLERLASLLFWEKGKERRTLSLIERVLKWVPARAETLAQLSQWHRFHGDFREELLYARLAASLELTRDDLAYEFFLTSQRLGESEEGLRFLEARYERYRKRSGFPAIALVKALEALDRVDEAFAVLEAAREQRPHDGALAAFAARMLARYGKHADAQAMMELAAEHLSRLEALELRAHLAELDGRLGDAHDACQQILDSSPNNWAALRSLLAFKAEFDGPQAPLSYVEELIKKSPPTYALYELAVEWGREQPRASVRAGLERILAFEPADSWAWREMALHEMDCGDLEAAQVAMDKAKKLSLLHPARYTVEVRLRAEKKDAQGSRALLIEALERYPDFEDALQLILACGETRDERRMLLHSVQDAVIGRSTEGRSVLALFHLAETLLDPDELGQLLSRLRSARPDYWATSVVSVRVARFLRQESEAEKWSLEATQRHPHFMAIWLERTETLLDQVNIPAARKAAERAAELSSFDRPAATKLAYIHRLEGNHADSRRVLERALRRAGRDAILLAELAHNSVRQGHIETALEEAHRAVLAAPTSSHGWEAYSEIAKLAGLEPNAPYRLSRKLAEERPHQVGLWVRLGDVAQEANFHAEAIEAYRRALKLEPQLVAALDPLALSLAVMGLFDEAFVVCQTEVTSGKLRLAMRHAWLVSVTRSSVEAIALLKEALQSSSDSLEGWRVLCDWASEEKDFKTAIFAAENLTRRAPLVPQSHGHLGRSRLLSGDVQGAKRCFLRAVEIDPTYTYAAEKLVEIAADETVLEASLVAKVLEQCAPHASGELVAFWKYVQASLGRDDAAAARAFEHLVIQSGASEELIERAVRTRWPKDTASARANLRQLMKLPGCHPHIVVIWLRLCDEQNVFPSSKEIEALCDELTDLEPTLLEGFYSVRDVDQESRWVKEAKHLEPRAQNHVRAWAYVGYAKYGTDEWGAMCWLSDCRNHKNVEPWMLCNLAIAYLHTQLLGRAEEVANHALKLPPDQSYPSLCAIASMFAAARGDYDTALELHVRASRDDTYFGRSEYCLAIARGLLSARGRLPGEPKSSAPLTRTLKEATLAIYLPTAQQALFRFGHRAAWRIAPWRVLVLLRAFGVYVLTTVALFFSLKVGLVMGTLVVWMWSQCLRAPDLKLPALGTGRPDHHE